MRDRERRHLKRRDLDRPTALRPPVRQRYLSRRDRNHLVSCPRVHNRPPYRRPPIALLIFPIGGGARSTSYTVEPLLVRAVVPKEVLTNTHAVWDRLNPIERDGFASILRTILSAPDLAVEFLALADRQATGGDSR
ncbi:hypothetical protein AB0A94_36575 [Streptomyces sp. NPDC044984]|uniref:hypothetical protein n=1 Tax=Streptomyces sp. NPDC044984 TaxID=3154335 RepID=UPI003408A36F